MAHGSRLTTPPTVPLGSTTGTLAKRRSDNDVTYSTDWPFCTKASSPPRQHTVSHLLDNPFAASEPVPPADSSRQPPKMAMSQAANLLGKAMGHTDTAITEQDVSNPARDRAKYADKSGETMKALCWMGKNDVQVCTSPTFALISCLLGLMAVRLQWRHRNQAFSRTGM